MAQNQKSLDKFMLDYKLGEEEAFKELYHAASPILNGYLRKRLSAAQDVEEVFQLVFAKLHTSREQYNPGYPFLPWFFTIVQSVLNDFLKAKIRSDERESEIARSLEAEARAPGQEDSHLKPQGLESLLMQFDRILPDSQSKAIKLRYLDEKSFEEVALALGTTEANARKLVSRAVKRLQVVKGRKR